jgi:polyhydroxybutyrate depolymerase
MATIRCGMHGLAGIRWLARLALAVLLVPALLSVAAARMKPPCTDCVLQGKKHPYGTFHVALPPGWNGHSPMKLLIFLHGYGANGQDMVADADVGGVAAKLGFMLVAPDGRGTSWAGTGMPGAAAPDGGRDDVAFLHAVLRDVEKRWPIDRSMVVLGGFSIGGSMTWQIACHAPRGFTAFLPMSGGFWLPMPAHCVAPVALRHLHGSDDKVVPLAGRVMLRRFHMGDIDQGLGIFRATDRCTAPARAFSDPGHEHCTEWAGCAAGGAVAVCLHPGGHEMRGDWMTAGLHWALAHPGRDK